MAINFYPECPEPDLTYGLPGHTDPNALTILLQDLHVSGLQVLKDGHWLAVKPHPNAFVINIGDQLQVIPSSFLHLPNSLSMNSTVLIVLVNKLLKYCKSVRVSDWYMLKFRVSNSTGNIKKIFKNFAGTEQWEV